MLERVMRARRTPALEDQLGINKLPQRPTQLALRTRGYGSQQLVGEFSADYRGCLRHLFRAREPVEPRHQRVLQTRGNGERITSGFFAQQSALEQALGQFLDEQRNAVGTLDDAVEDFGRQTFAAGDAVDESGCVAPRQSVQRQQGDMRWP